VLSVQHHESTMERAKPYKTSTMKIAFQKFRLTLTLIAVLLIPVVVCAQTNYFSTSTFYNKVRFNPSQAGLSKDVNFDVSFKTPLDNSQTGLAKEFAFSADMPISETAGVGMVFQNQSGGLLKQTLFNFCYAYGIKFKENLNLRFGIGAGFKNIRADESSSSNTGIIGDLNDPALSAYNSIPPSFYSSLSFTLYTKNIELQLVAPNLTASLQNKNLQSLDYLMLQGGLSYQAAIGGGKLLNSDSYIKAFAGIMQYKQTGSIITGGLLLNTNGFLSASAQYNTSGVITAGVGIPVEKILLINVNYSIGGLYSKTIYGGGGVTEIHINYTLKKKQS
jgi:hypothetical protein